MLRFHIWKIEKVQQRTKSLSSRLFEGQLQFHVRKEPQTGPKLVGKEEVLAVVWQISELSKKATKVSNIRKL